MKNNMVLKRIGALIGACAVFIGLCGMPASAADSARVDLDAGVSLTLQAVNGTVRVSNMTFRAYRIADMDAGGNYTVTDSISRAYPSMNTNYTSFTAQNWVDYAATMAANLARDNAPAADVAVTNGQGTLTFDSSKLSAGIYLITGDSVRNGTTTYTTTPFVVSLPSRTVVGGSWTYDVTASPKIEGTPDTVITPPPVVNVPPPTVVTPPTPTTIPPTPTVSVPPVETVDVPPTGEVRGVRREEPGPDIPEVVEGVVKGANRLPQTGLLWWPAPVMFIVGSALFLYGRRIGEMEKARAI